MALYPFETQLVLSQDGTSVLLTNTQVTLFDPSDAGFNSPIALVDNSGTAIGNPVLVTPQGFLPAFQASIPQVMWLGGGYYGYISSYKGIRDEAVAAANSAANSAQNAINARTAAEAAASLAAAPTDASVDAGIARANVVVKWLPSTPYTAGQAVVNPEGQLALCTITHTSATAYDTSKFSVTASGTGGAAGAVASPTNFAVQNLTTGAMPARPTSDPDVLVFWISWTQPTRVTTGTGGAYPNDVWLQRTAP